MIQRLNDTEWDNRIGKRVIDDINMLNQKRFDSTKPSGFCLSDQILQVRVCDLVEAPQPHLTCFSQHIRAFWSQRLEIILVFSP